MATATEEGIVSEIEARHLRNVWLWWRARGKPNPGCGMGGCAHPCPHPLRGLCYVESEEYGRKMAINRLRKVAEARRRAWWDAENRRLPTAKQLFEEYLDAKRDLLLNDGSPS